ncbi:hypothetical protein RI367_006306 [Sorochytrium milnesiophthora]
MGKVLTALLLLALCATQAWAIDVSNRYIVLFKDSVQMAQVNQTILASIDTHNKRLLQLRAHPLEGVQVPAYDNHYHHTYNFGTFKGMAGTFTPELLAEIKARDDVVSVTPDGIMHSSGQQNNAPWNLVRLSQRNNPDYSQPWLWWDDSQGYGMTVFVLDSGVAQNGNELRGRLFRGFKPSDQWTWADETGHGTHDKASSVAGIIASQSWGVAKQANIVSVRVLGKDGAGAVSDIVAGIAYIAPWCKLFGPRGSVINMSLGGPVFDAIEQAIQTAIDQNGCIFVVAAGNDGKDASTNSPARMKDVITVGATTKDDQLAWFSNFGPKADILAPGVDITSIWNNGSTNTLSGTSMAAPHVTGVVATWLSGPRYQGFYERDMKAHLVQMATRNAIKLNQGDGTTANNLLWAYP